jgi:hypothetical protein
MWPRPQISLFPLKGFRWVRQMRGRRSGWQLFAARNQTVAVAVLPFDKMAGGALPGGVKLFCTFLPDFGYSTLAPD